MTDVSRQPGFVVATPQRTVCDDNARALHGAGLLRLLALGTRHGARDIPPELTRLNPRIGLCAYLGACVLNTYRAESFRFRLLPWFDRWVLGHLLPGDHLISSYGYANACFDFVRQNGGKTFVDAGNSHIENFWEILSEEHRRWNSAYPPVSRYWYERSRAMLSGVDYVLSPSSYVTESFLARGFRRSQILRNIYPIDLSVFQPAPAARNSKRLLTIVNTGSLSLRKGTPYLLEAFKLIRLKHPNARLLLTKSIREDMRPVLARYRDLPIEWSPPLPHARLAERLRSADVYVLPSLEEGLARTALEAMACGLPVVLTSHTGANDFVETGINGEIVPIRDPVATAEGILKCWERLLAGARPTVAGLQQRLSFQTFAPEFIGQLDTLGLTKSIAGAIS